MNSLPKTANRQRRGCYLNPGRSAPESSSLTTRLPSHPTACRAVHTVNLAPLHAVAAEHSRGIAPVTPKRYSTVRFDHFRRPYATLTRGFDFHAAWGFLLVFYGNRGYKMHRSLGYEHGTDRDLLFRFLISMLYVFSTRKFLPQAM